MGKLSPKLALANAYHELRRAREECPHWDMESDGGHSECCYRVDDARRAVRRLVKEAGES